MSFKPKDSCNAVNHLQWDLLDRLYRNKNLTFIRRPRLPLTTIAVECAAAWQIPILQLKGKIQHSNPVDKAIKYSFLFALHMFSDCSIREVEAHFGYGRALYTAGQHIIYEGGSKRKHGKTLRSLFAALFELCPEAYEQWSELVPRKSTGWERPDLQLVFCVSNDQYIYRDGAGLVGFWHPAPNLIVGHLYISNGLCVDYDGDLCYWIKEDNRLHPTTRFVEKQTKNL